MPPKKEGEEEGEPPNDNVDELSDDELQRQLDAALAEDEDATSGVYGDFDLWYELTGYLDYADAARIMPKYAALQRRIIRLQDEFRRRAEARAAATAAAAATAPRSAAAVKHPREYDGEDEDDRDTKRRNIDKSRDKRRQETTADEESAYKQHAAEDEDDGWPVAINQQRREFRRQREAFFGIRGLRPAISNQEQHEWYDVESGAPASDAAVEEVEAAFERQLEQQRGPQQPNAAAAAGPDVPDFDGGEQQHELSVSTTSSHAGRGRGRPRKVRLVHQGVAGGNGDPVVRADGAAVGSPNWVATIWQPLSPELRARIRGLEANQQLIYFHGRLQQAPNARVDNRTRGRHWQCYLELPKKMTADQVRDLLGIQNIFLQPRRGSRRDALEYIDQSRTNLTDEDNQAAEGDYSDKDIITFTVGAPKDANAADAWAEVRAAVEAGGSFEDVVNTHFRLAVQYPTGINKVIAAKTKAKPRDVKCYCYWGPTGSGKTTKVYDTYGYDDVYRKLAGQWWCGYETQKVIFFDDYYGSEYGLTFDYLLQVTDRHPLTVNVRNGTRAAQWDKVIFTSNEHPYTWFPKVSEAKLAAFKRRLPPENIIYVPMPTTSVTSLARTSSTVSTTAAPYAEPDPPSPGIGMLKRENAFSVSSFDLETIS